MNPSSSLNFVGRIKWEVLDRDTKAFIRGGEGKNLTVNAGIDAIVTTLCGGAAFAIDTLKIGTDHTAFTATNTDLGAVLQTKTLPAITITNSGTSLEVSTYFLFAGPYTIGETGLFGGGTAWALTNEISEDVNSTQMLSILWTVALQSA